MAELELAIARAGSIPILAYSISKQMIFLAVCAHAMNYDVTMSG